MTHRLCQKRPVPGIAQKRQRLCRRQPHRAMTCFSWRSDRAHRPGQIDAAQLFCPKVIIGHVTEPSKRPETPFDADGPAGFLHHLAVQGSDRVFARVNPAPRKLKLRLWVLLKRGQDVIPVPQHGIDTRPPPIVLPGLHCFAISPDHLLGLELAAPI